MLGQGAPAHQDHRDDTDRTHPSRDGRIARARPRPTLVTLAVASGMLAAVLLTALVVRIGQPETVQSTEVDLAGLQRRLTERVAFDVARLQLDPDRNQVRDQLSEAALRLRRVRTGLLGGDDGLGVDGIVPVDVRMRQRHEDGTVAVEISDTGVGIAEDEQSRILERFYRTRNSQRSETPGSGLGLAIAANLVELHHGTIGVRSAEGEGTTVTVTLPALGRDRIGGPAAVEHR